MSCDPFLPPEWVASVPSSNDVLLGRLASGEALPHGYVLAAREQTAGRGRQGRTWVSGAADLAFSFVWRTGSGPERFPSLPMAAALAVRAALSESGVAARTKWPNDVLAGGRKIGGILSETGRQRPGNRAVLVVGIGVNVNTTAAEAGRIRPAATSLRAETGRRHRVAALLDAVLRELAGRLARWETGGFEGVRDEWSAHCVWRGQEITVTGEGGARSGILAGFGSQGELLLKEPGGSIRAIWAGDAGVREAGSVAGETGS